MAIWAAASQQPRIFYCWLWVLWKHSPPGHLLAVATSPLCHIWRDHWIWFSMHFRPGWNFLAVDGLISKVVIHRHQTHSRNNQTESHQQANHCKPCWWQHSERWHANIETQPNGHMPAPRKESTRVCWRRFRRVLPNRYLYEVVLMGHALLAHYVYYYRLLCLDDICDHFNTQAWARVLSMLMYILYMLLLRW